MIKIKHTVNRKMFTVQNTSGNDEKVTICRDEYSGMLKAYRAINEQESEYVDKYIEDDVYIIYNAPGNSLTVFVNE